MSATDWLHILDAIGDDRRLVVQRGIDPRTVEIRIEERDPLGRRISYLVTREAIEYAQIDVVMATIDHCTARLNEQSAPARST
jgi:hypothetical protein